MITPRKYQLIGIEWLKRSGGRYLADDMGIGKTVQAVFAAKDMPGPYLVITRPLNKLNWRDMIHEIAPNAEVMIAGVAGKFDIGGVLSWFAHPRKLGFLIMHHEALQFSLDKYDKSGFRIVKRAQYSLKFGMWEAVIADEAHRFNNRNSIMTKALKAIHCYRRWALTGTPMDKTPADMWSMLNWFNDKEFNAYWPFYEKYVDFETGWHNERLIKGVKDADLFAARITPYYLRRTKEDPEIASELPSKIYKNIPLPMGDEQQYVYDQFCRVGFAFEGTENEEYIGNALKSIMKLRRIALDPHLVGPERASVKLEWLGDFIGGHEEQVVIFTSSREFANRLPLLIEGGGSITGDDKSAERLLVLDLFKKSKLKYVIGTIDTMSEAIDGLQVASIAVFADLHNSSIQMQQAEDRVHRLGSRSAVTIIRLLCVDSIDYIMLEALQRKWTTIETIRAAIKHATAHKIHS